MTTDKRQSDQPFDQIPTRIALIGDLDVTSHVHAAIELSIELAQAELSPMTIHWKWVPSSKADAPDALAYFDGLWCTPGTPYSSLNGALEAIQFARKSGRPFLGTCGGFQHALLEHARHVMQWSDAGHAEIWPEAPRPVICLLDKPLVNVTEPLVLSDQRFVNLCGGEEKEIGIYWCRYSINPMLAARLWDEDFVPVARAFDGAVRAVTRLRHPFFFATLYQPELLAFSGKAHPLITSFLSACRSQRLTRSSART